MTLRVWWVVNVPGKFEYAPVVGFVEALDTIARLGPHEAHGLEVWHERWEEWYDYDQEDQAATYGTIDDVDDTRAEELDRRNNTSNLLQEERSNVQLRKFCADKRP